MSEGGAPLELPLHRRSSGQSNEQQGFSSERSLEEALLDRGNSADNAGNKGGRRRVDGGPDFIRDMFNPNIAGPHADDRSDGSGNSDRETLIEELRRDLAEGDAVLENIHLKRKLRLRQQKVLTLEIRSNGQTRYKQRTLRDLFLYIRKLISQIEDLSHPSEMYDARRMKKKSTRTSGQWLRARDLHKIESFGTSEPMIMVRRHCVLFALEPLRGVVMWDRLIVLVPDGADSLIHVLETELQSHVQDVENYGADNAPASVLPANAKSRKKKRRRSLPHKRSASLRLSSTDLRQNLPDGTTLYWSQDAESLLQKRRQQHHAGEGGMRRVASESKLYVDDEEDETMDGGESESGSTAVLGSFELRALEALLATMVYLQNRAYDKLSARTEAVVTQISKIMTVSAETQERLRLLKNSTTGLSARMQSYLRALDEVLEDDEDMALMNLTKLHDKPSLYSLPLQPEILSAHEEMELLFEAYAQDFNTLATNLKILQGHVTNAEELLLLRLDTARNQLLTAETIFTLISMCFGIGSFVGSIFGMNLLSHMEEDPDYFRIVTLITTGGIVLLGVSIFIFFRQHGVFVA